MELRCRVVCVGWQVHIIAAFSRSTLSPAPGHNGFGDGRFGDGKLGEGRQTSRESVVRVSSSR